METPNGWMILNEYDLMDINRICKEVHAIALKQGFWENKDIPTKLMLCVTELGESCEAHRCNDNDGFREELIDTLIRLLDLLGYLKVDVEKELLKKHEENKKRPYKHNKAY